MRVASPPSRPENMTNESNMAMKNSEKLSFSIRRLAEKRTAENKRRIYIFVPFFVISHLSPNDY